MTDRPKQTSCRDSLRASRDSVLGGKGTSNCGTANQQEASTSSLNLSILSSCADCYPNAPGERWFVCCDSLAHFPAVRLFFLLVSWQQPYIGDQEKLRHYFDFLVV